MKKDLTDEELVLNCLKKDRKSQEILYKKYFGKMCTVAYRYVGKESYKDVAQDSLIKFFNNIKIYNGGNIEGWLRKITVNTALDHLRVSNRMHFLKIEDSASAWENFTELHRLHDYKTNPDEETEYCKALKYKINEKELLDMIDSLSTSYKICFNLYVFEELKCNEIALKLNLSVGTVKSNLFRARQSLIRKLNKRIEKRVIT